jgi:hypothetical protein
LARFFEFMDEQETALQPTEQQQAALWPEIERDVLTIDQPETRKRYTAASLEKRVALRDAIVRALAEGHGLRRIAGVFGVSHHLVSALRDSRPDLVATEKKAMSNQLGRIAKLTADSLQERLEAGTWKPGSVDLAIILDKKAMLDGDPGLIVEHRHSVEVSAGGFAERLRAAIESKSIGGSVICQQKGAFVDVVALPVATGAGEQDQQPGATDTGRDKVGGTEGGGGDAAGARPACDPMYPPIATK